MTSMSGPFVGEINYSDSWEKRLRETGIKPEHVASEDISIREYPGQFPISGDGVKKVRYELVRFGRRVTYDEVLDGFAKRGLKRPGPEHGLDFAKRYPDAQLSSSGIIIPCSPGATGGYLIVLVLYACIPESMRYVFGDGFDNLYTERWLGIQCFDDWSDDDVFLGVRED